MFLLHNCLFLIDVLFGPNCEKKRNKKKFLLACLDEGRDACDELIGQGEEALEGDGVVASVEEAAEAAVEGEAAGAAPAAVPVQGCQEETNSDRIGRTRGRCVFAKY